MKQYKCLIVDDLLTTKTILDDYLNQLSFFQKTQSCNSIPEAIPLINQTRFDLIFLNMQQPGSSELTLFQTFVQDTPIISTTACTSSAIHCTGLNIIDCVLRPYNFPRFTRAINRALDVQSIAEQAGESKSELRIFWENLTADRKRDLGLLFSRIAFHENTL